MTAIATPASAAPALSPEACEEAILAERAARFAQRRQTDAGTRNVALMLVFVIGEQRYGLKVDLVREVSPARALVKVWRAPEQVLGVINIRGEIVTVLGFAHLLNLPCRENVRGGIVLLLRRRDSLVGLYVDDVLRTQPMPAAQDLRRAEDVCNSPCVQGVTEDGIVVLDADGVIGAMRSSPQRGTTKNGKEGRGGLS